MTIERDKVKPFDVLHFVADNAGLSTFEAIEKAYNMGVYEQGLVLDKIRAEIDAESAKSFKYPNWERAKALEWTLSIIDKYIAESEE